MLVDFQNSFTGVLTMKFATKLMPYCPPHVRCFAALPRDRGGSVIKFCTGVRVPDLITSAKFGGHRFAGFGDSGGQISPFSIEVHWLTLSSLKHPATTVPVCDNTKGITQFHLPPTHKPFLFCTPSCRASPLFGWYWLCLPTKGWPVWVDLGGWLHTGVNIRRR